MPTTAHPRAVHPQLQFSSVDPYIGDPACELFENLRVAPSPPTRQVQSEANQKQQMDEGLGRFGGHNLTSADGVGENTNMKYGRSSTLLHDPKEESYDISELMKLDVGVPRNKSSGRSIASFFGIGKRRGNVTENGNDHRTSFLEHNRSGDSEQSVGDGNDRNGISRTPIKTTIVRGVASGHPAKPLPETPLGSRDLPTASSQETGFLRFVNNPIHFRKPALENMQRETRDIKAETNKLDNRRTRFAAGLRNSVLGLLVQVKDSKSNRIETLAKAEERDTRQKQNEKRQIRSIGVSHEMLRNRDLSLMPSRKRNKSLTELNIGNPVLVIPPSYKTLLPLEVAQNDPLIRQRGQPTYQTGGALAERQGYRKSGNQLVATLAPHNGKSARSEVSEAWLVEALGSFDGDVTSARELRGKSQGREKATTPSQEIVRQTKASWTGKAPVDISLENSLSEDSHTCHRPLITRSQTVQRDARKEVCAPHLSLWSDSFLSNEASKSSVTQGPVRQGYPRRQTQTFHEVPTNRYTGSKSGDTHTHRTSRRLQAITGVPCESEDQRKVRKVKECRDTYKQNKESIQCQRFPRTSSMLPLHDRRESSVYCIAAGPATPPPSSPLPAIPTSSSLTDCRSSASKASLLYTPISPIPTLSTSASTWSWQLTADSPASQLLNEMKNATDVVGKTHKPNMIPTKRHVQQRSITSSLSSSGLLDDIPEQSRRMKSQPAGDTQDIRRNAVDNIVSTRLDNRYSDFQPTNKSAVTATLASAHEPELSPNHVVSKKRQEGSQSSKSTVSKSAGSPSSIVNLYMSRSQQTLAGRE